MKNSYLFLATGFEEIEALATVDILRRAQLPVTTVSVYENKEVTGAHGIVTVADTTISECDFENVDWLILPGGLPGADNLLACRQLADMLKKHHAAGGRIAAICASPAVVLSPLGIVEGKNATAYPGFEDKLEEGGAKATRARVTVDGNVITANGPASAFPFAFTIIEHTLSRDVADQVASGLLAPQF